MLALQAACVFVCMRVQLTMHLNRSRMHTIAYIHVLGFTYVDLMVMHRSFSSLRVSVMRSPTLPTDTIPALLTSESVSVDLPWSTCAITDMLRILLRLPIMARTYNTFCKN